MFDHGAVDFKSGCDAEKHFNSVLAARERADGPIKVWQMTPGFEAQVRPALGGDGAYQVVAGRFPGVGSKSIKQLSIAMETDVPVAKPFDKIPCWLCVQNV